MADKNSKKNKLSHLEKESQLCSKLAQEIHSLGISLTPRQRTEVINFVRCRTHILDLRSGDLDKRSIEKDLQFRIGTLAQVSKQIVRDQKSYKVKDDDFIKRQIFLALIETATLIQERKIKSDIRDDHSVDFHLWVMNQMLTSYGLAKPSYVLTAILEKIGFWGGRGTALKVSTIQNKILYANKLITAARKKGICHPIDLVSESAQWYSEKFISTLAQGCPKCSKIWIQILGVKGTKDTPWNLAILELKKKLPSLAKEIKLVGESLTDEGDHGMPLRQILDYLPRKYQGSFQHLFEAKLFV